VLVPAKYSVFPLIVKTCPFAFAKLVMVEVAKDGALDVVVPTWPPVAVALPLPMMRNKFVVIGIQRKKSCLFLEYIVNSIDLIRNSNSPRHKSWPLTNSLLHLTDSAECTIGLIMNTYTGHRQSAVQTQLRLGMPTIKTRSS